MTQHPLGCHKNIHGWKRWGVWCCSPKKTQRQLVISLLPGPPVPSPGSVAGQSQQWIGESKFGVKFPNLCFWALNCFQIFLFSATHIDVLILDSAKVKEVLLEERLLEEHGDFSRKQKQLQVLVQILPVVHGILCSVHTGSAHWICTQSPLLCVCRITAQPLAVDSQEFMPYD